MGGRPIANKYREGKMKRTLKRELKVLEIVKREAIGSSEVPHSNHQKVSLLTLGFYEDFIVSPISSLFWITYDLCTLNGNESA